MSPPNMAASVRAKLLNRARETGQDFNLVLTRYALERLLYRISVSDHCNDFLLKGALLFDLWFDVPHRPTRDADFLGFGSAELPYLQNLFKELCSFNVNDGILFKNETVIAKEIRKDSNYAGVRITLLSVLDGARCQVQVDIGFGDAVTPSPQTVDYPVMLPEFESPKLRAYPHYTVVAEKFHVITSLGIANSRMKDYFDLWILSQHSTFNGETLKQAIAATFERRKTPLPKNVPFGLSEAFTKDTQKQTQWRAFMQKNNLNAATLPEITNTLSDFLMPAVASSINGTEFSLEWESGGPWSN